jgi:hypothetical protein
MRYVILLYALLAASTSFADLPLCSDGSVTVVFDRKKASAGFFANMLGSSGSIRSESEKMLTAAELTIKDTKPPQLKCAPGCAPLRKPKIVFTVIPRLFLSEYDDQEKCRQYLAETSIKPIAYLNGLFSDFDEFSSHFSDFSRGSGKLGKDLYKRCDGACSPQYRVVITTTPGQKYSGDSLVVCGEARDKDDNYYHLTTALLWECGPESFSP